MRGFFAFGIDELLSRDLLATASALPPDPALSLYLPADYHVTIKFLSEFSSVNFIACLDELRAIGAPPAQSLRAGSLALWPTVLVLECEPSEELRVWHGRVNALLERKGFLKERHPRFHPHITLARRKPGKDLPQVEAALANVKAKFLGKTVELLPPALWQSQKEETGRRHRPLISPWYG